MYIVEYLVEMGVVQGEHALPYSEIESWQRQCGIELQPWEVRFVKRLSSAYLNESHIARDPDAKAPYFVPQVLPPQSGALMSYFGSMK